MVADGDRCCTGGVSARARVAAASGARSVAVTHPSPRTAATTVSESGSSKLEPPDGTAAHTCDL